MIKMNKRLRLFAYVVCLLLLFVSSGCKSQKSMMEDMKKEIPNAVKFIEENENNLSTLLNIQNCLNDISYVFYRDNSMSIFEYVDGSTYKRVNSYDNHSEVLISIDENDIIKDLFEKLDSTSYSIEITPDYIQIMYKQLNHGKNVADLYIVNRSIDDFHVSDVLIYEIVDETWIITVSTWRRV
ncbi:MAG: hypothetical protein FWG88_11025 [Oscillospiraceae bacterium]|nr:hypothetical protein [Oscillospiraceae bacterium]